MIYLSKNLFDLLYRLEDKLSTKDSYDGINGVVEEGEGISINEIEDLARYQLIKSLFFNFNGHWCCQYSFTDRGKEYLEKHRK